MRITTLFRRLGIVLFVIAIPIVLIFVATVIFVSVNCLADKLCGPYVITDTTTGHIYHVDSYLRNHGGAAVFYEDNKLITISSYAVESEKK